MARAHAPATRVLSGVSAQAVAVRENVILVAGMGVLSMAHMNPGGRLDWLSHVETPGVAIDVAVRNDEVFVADGLAGLSAYTLSRSGAVTLTTRTLLPTDCKRVVASEHGVAVLCARRTLAMVRRGRPGEVLDLPGEPLDAAWVGASLHVACPGDGLLRVDVDAERARVASRDPSLHRVVSVVSQGKRLFLGMRDKRILDVDISADKPHLLGEVTVLNRPMRLFVENNRLLVASTMYGDTGATWVDVSSPGQPRIEGRLPMSVAAGAYLGSRGWLLVRPEGGLSLVANDGTISTLDEGVRFDRVATSSSRGIAWAEERAGMWTWARGAAQATRTARELADATACGEAVCTLEATGRVCRHAPGSNAITCANVVQSGAAVAWQSATNTLWVIDGEGGVHGLSMQTSFHEISSIVRDETVAPKNYERFVIIDQRGVAVDIDMGLLQVLDVGAAPRLRGRFLSHARPKSVALANDVAFVAEPYAGLQVVDVSQPDAPREVAWLPFEVGPFGVAARSIEGDARGAIVLLAEGEHGVSVWRWDGAQRTLALVNRVDTAGFASDLVLGAAEVLVADGASVLRFSWPELVR